MLIKPELHCDIKPSFRSIEIPHNAPTLDRYFYSKVYFCIQKIETRIQLHRYLIDLHALHLFSDAMHILISNTFPALGPMMFYSFR